MMPPLEGSTHLPLLQHLCVSCGACCDGTLFECLELEGEEIAALPPGLTVALEGPEAGSATGFMFPCPMHVAGSCEIYANRPTRCQQFACKVYERYEAGQATWEEAASRIAELKELGAALARLLNWEEHQFSTQRFRQWAAQFPGGEAAARRAHPAAFAKYGALRVYMERHFIRAKDRTSGA